MRYYLPRRRPPPRPGVIMKAIKIVGELLVPSLTEEGNGGGKSREVETRAMYTLLEVNIFSVPILFRDRIEARSSLEAIARIVLPPNARPVNGIEQTVPPSRARSILNV